MNEETANAITDLISSLEESLPPLFDRKAAVKALNGIVSIKALSNADANGVGPKIKMRIGKKVIYDRTSFLEWLRYRIR